MKVFVSWSGDLARDVAASIRSWLPRVLQGASPYMSSTDIFAGTRWFAEISQELERSDFGILCITRSNLRAPWLLFEAGALSKSLSRSRVVPLLVDVSLSDLDGPLAHFHAVTLSKADILKLIESLNEAGPALEKSLLLASFEKWWPDLYSELTALLESQTRLSEAAQREAPIRSEREMLEELLALCRDMLRSSPTAAAAAAERKAVAAPPSEADSIPSSLRELAARHAEEAVVGGTRAGDVIDRLVTHGVPRHIAGALVREAELRMRHSRKNDPGSAPNPAPAPDAQARR